MRWAPGTQASREDPAGDAQPLDIGTDDIPLSDEVPPDKAPPARTTQRTATCMGDPYFLEILLRWVIVKLLSTAYTRTLTAFNIEFTLISTK